MGSSIGNLSRSEAAAFLKRFVAILDKDDSMLIGIDACQTESKVYQAYNESLGLTHRFILNGLRNANHILGQNVFDEDYWQVFGSWNEAAGRHEAFVYPRKDVVVDGILIAAGEKVRIEESHKYSIAQTHQLFRDSMLDSKEVFGNKTNDYRKAFPIAFCFQKDFTMEVLYIVAVLGGRSQHHKDRQRPYLNSSNQLAATPQK